MIEVRNLSIGYRNGKRKTCIASCIDARIDDGRLCCLTGRNGTGKSTLLRTLAGLLPPLSGSVTAGCDGTLPISIAEASDSGKSRLVSIVLTGHTDTGLLKVRDVVGFGRIPYSGILGKLSCQDKLAVDRAIRLVGIEDLEHKDIDCLSDGEYQKVMIAKALAQETPVILLDEPSAFLDWPSKHELMDLLVRLAHEHGKTILLSSHDLDIIRDRADVYWTMARTDGNCILRQSDRLPSEMP
ncbi:MAG: ABC transporter ATP-binding protein [Bacteroidaceae bacterium]|nr:ABC transporter ATP-binding protein [Bacteroidaceae bacterium]